MSDVTYRKVPIDPVACLRDSARLMEGQYLLMLAVVWVGIFITTLVPIVLIGPMYCGIFLCYLLRMRKQEATFEALFKGFDYFVEGLIAALIYHLILAAIATPLVCIAVGGVLLAGTAAGNGSETAGIILTIVLILGGFLLALVNMWISVVFNFVWLLIVDYGMSAMSAIKAAFGASFANFGGTLGLSLLLLLVTLLAVFLCIVPVIFVMPYCLGAAALAYRKIFPPPEKPPLVH